MEKKCAEYNKKYDEAKGHYISLKERFNLIQLDLEKYKGQNGSVDRKHEGSTSHNDKEVKEKYESLKIKFKVSP